MKNYIVGNVMFLNDKRETVKSRKRLYCVTERVAVSNKENKTFFRSRGKWYDITLSSYLVTPEYAREYLTAEALLARLEQWFEHEVECPQLPIYRELLESLRLEGEEQHERVVFRKTKEGEIIALFPDCTNYQGTLCYAHIGQHFSANYAYMVRSTVPATSSEYAELYAELVRLFDYVLHVVKKSRITVNKYPWELQK